MKFLLDSIAKTPQYTELSASVRSSELPAMAAGLSGVEKAVCIAAMIHDHPEIPSFLILCPNDIEAQKIQDDLMALSVPSLLYQTKDFNFRDTVESKTNEYEHRRLYALSRLASGSDFRCVVSGIEAALQYTIPKEVLLSHSRTIHVDDMLSLDDILQHLLSCGYERAEQIDGIGQFSLRGGILDIFSPGSPLPVRIELFGDQVETIFSFDVLTQRRIESVDSADIIPTDEILIQDPDRLADILMKHARTLRGKHAEKAREHIGTYVDKLNQNVNLPKIDTFLPLLYDSQASLIDYLPDSSVFIFSEAVRQKETMLSAEKQWTEDLKALREEGLLFRGCTSFSDSWEDLIAGPHQPGFLFLESFTHGSSEVPLKHLVSFSLNLVSPWSGKLSVLKEELADIMKRKYSCIIMAGTEKGSRTLADDLSELGIPARYETDPHPTAESPVVVTPGYLSTGLEIPDAKLSVLSYKRNTHLAAKKKPKNSKQVKELFSISDLTVGDYVVHDSHGIGIFMGVHTITVQNITKDYIKIQYAQKDVLYVPVTQLDLISKYIGSSEDSVIRLNRLGNSDWKKSKAKVRKAVKDIARELIRLYAERMQSRGYSFSPDSEIQKDFESHFEFEETSDQLRCVEEIKHDMESSTPMDRLLCGDVGFGKTEVALRAAFKCILDNKQCAILVPTTILAWQHYQTICRRMDNFPVNIEFISRFKTDKQQREVLKKLKTGQIDIIIGTHRLISKDVAFHDLGLVIIDEEQRFGVTQKERMKVLAPHIDILTLSATPIPRTLNMALSGIRDMSIIEEAPLDRHPVQTYVIEYDIETLVNAMQRELRRGGQVFYLYNNTEKIGQIASQLRSLLPDARIEIAHGKMSETELSDIWRRMLEQEIDVLVCTTIIETGVDVPNANTLIIDQADRMGLSQLHQIRGRVGRSSRRAYAYFTFRKNAVLSEIANKRLTALQEYTEFGSGFKIAMRDLEIRGAGNVLGGEQHGHMESVGYELYVKLLNEAIQSAKGTPVPEQEQDCFININIDAYIPESYIESLAQRLDAYRKIASIESGEDAAEITDELLDRYGRIPKVIHSLIDVSLLKKEATAAGLSEIREQGNRILLFPADMESFHLQPLETVYKKRLELMNRRGKPAAAAIRIPKDRTAFEIIQESVAILKESRNTDKATGQKP